MKHRGRKIAAGMTTMAMLAIVTVTGVGAQTGSHGAGTGMGAGADTGAGTAAGAGTGMGAGTGTADATGGAVVPGAAATGNASGTARDAAIAAGTAAPTVPDQDANFLMTAASSGMAEVETARMALERASDPQVKKHAQMMIDDHTKANEELKTIAATKQVPLPSEPNTVHKQMVEKLRDMKGEQFDEAYMQAEVKEHQSAVALFGQQKDAGKDANLKAFAAKTEPKLQHHLQEATKIAQDVSSDDAQGADKGL